MLLLIAGASHAGKPCLAQKLLEKLKYPYLSIDHLKMGLIRSHQTTLSVEDDDQLTLYLWPIVQEIIKTAIENDQNLIIEGCYIPFDWEKDFEPAYKNKIRYVCLILSETYIRKHFCQISKHARIIENRIDDEWYTIDHAIEENARYHAQAKKHRLKTILIEDQYETELENAIRLIYESS